MLFCCSPSPPAPVSRTKPATKPTGKVARKKGGLSARPRSTEGAKKDVTASTVVADLAMQQAGEPQQAKREKPRLTPGSSFTNEPTLADGESTPSTQNAVTADASAQTEAESSNGPKLSDTELAALFQKLHAGEARLAPEELKRVIAALAPSGHCFVRAVKNAVAQASSFKGAGVPAPTAKLAAMELEAGLKLLAMTQQVPGSAASAERSAAAATAPASAAAAAAPASAAAAAAPAATGESRKQAEPAQEAAVSSHQGSQALSSRPSSRQLSGSMAFSGPLAPNTLSGYDRPGVFMKNLMLAPPANKLARPPKK